MSCFIASFSSVRVAMIRRIRTFSSSMVRARGNLGAPHAAVLRFPRANRVGMTPCRRPSSTNVPPASCSLRSLRSAPR